MGFEDQFSSCFTQVNCHSHGLLRLCSHPCIPLLLVHDYTAALTFFMGHGFFEFDGMEKMERENIVPGQHTGKAIDAKASVDFTNQQDAREFFNMVKQRLLDVNNWHNIAKSLSAKFQLVRSDKTNETGAPGKGDYFKIDIPGPGSKAGRGYDWVQIEDIEDTSTDDYESYGIRVRPTDNPETTDKDVAHFYSPESTSTFLVTRKGNTVKAEIFDRNTKPNDDTTTLIDKIRHKVVGATGVAAFSKIQWQGLVDGLIART
jgi:hypothetical protein